MNREPYEPFTTLELGKAMSALGSEITKSYGGVSGEVSEFVSSFRRSDRALLVASLEAITEGMKANFNPFDDLLYKLAALPGRQVIVSGDFPATGKEPADDKS